MVRFLINLVIYLASAVLAIFVADMVLEDFTVGYPMGLLVAAVIFAVIQAILSPLVLKLTAKYASFLMGGVGLVSTFVALLLTVLITGDDGLEIDGFGGWFLGTVIVWLITAIGGWLLALIFLKNRANNR